MTAATVPSLRELTEHELSQAWAAGLVDLATVEAECARRERADRARAAARRRHAEWETAARANFDAAEAYCRGDDNMLNARGRARGLTPWQLWHGAEDLARRYASDDLLNFWDHVSPRVPGPGAYQAGKRRAEQDARDRAGLDATPAPKRTERTAPAMRAPSARELAEQAAAAPRTAPKAPGSIARYITALGHLQRQADRTARVLARVNGGIQR